MTTVPGRPTLRRQNSGTLAGYIHGATLTTSGIIVINGQPTFQSHMFQPEPQDLTDQPAATTTPTGGATPVLPVATTPTAILDAPFSVKALSQQLTAVSRLLKNADKEAAAKSSLYRSLRTPMKGKGKSLLPNAASGHLFFKAVREAIDASPGTDLTPAGLINAVRHAGLPVKTKRRLLLLELDKHFTA
jgi:hypothetical protein